MPKKTKDSESTELKQKKAVAVSKKSTSTKKTSSTTKKATTKKATAQKTTAKKTTAKKSSTKTTTKKVAKTKKTNKKIDIVEYYDLPYRYNQTVVKILAQTPTNLFIYWDISDEDRENYKKQYGENFFENTKPILKIFNDTMHYSFEVEINDFANSWYLHVNDSKCDYRVELGRKPIEYNNQNNQIDANYIHISSSNKIESPNDKILFNKMQQMVYFKNVKTNSTKSKSVATLSFIRNMGKIYNIYDLYKEIYKNENLEEFNNPTSNFF